jgi:hypothetical protein
VISQLHEGKKNEFHTKKQKKFQKVYSARQKNPHKTNKNSRYTDEERTRVNQVMLMLFFVFHSLILFPTGMILK